MPWAWQGGPAEGGWWPMMGFGWLMFLLMIIACVAMMLFMRRRHGMMGCMHHGNDGDRALGTLRERYAKGEITKADFDQMRQDLG